MWHHSTKLSTSHLYNSIYQWKGSVSTKAAFALQLVALAIGDHLALALAKLAQRLDVNAVFSEFLFHRQWLCLIQPAVIATKAHSPIRKGSPWR